MLTSVAPAGVSSFLVSFKSSQDFVSQTFYQLPTQFYLFQNLVTVIQRVPPAAPTSSIPCCTRSCGTVVVIITASMAGFSIVRLRPKFNFLLFLIIYSGTLFPFQMYLIPVYRLFNTLGLYDTRTGMILIYSAICIPFSLFVYRGFYTTIPREIEEAAKLDGCGPLRSFVSVFLPQSLPPTAGRGAVPGHLDLERPALRHGALADAERAAHHGGRGHDDRLRRRQHPLDHDRGHLHLHPHDPALRGAAEVLHPGHGALDHF